LNVAKCVDVVSDTGHAIDLRCQCYIDYIYLI